MHKRKNACERNKLQTIHWCVRMHTTRSWVCWLAWWWSWYLRMIFDLKITSKDKKWAKRGFGETVRIVSIRHFRSYILDSLSTLLLNHFNKLSVYRNAYLLLDTKNETNKYIRLLYMKELSWPTYETGKPWEELWYYLAQITQVTMLPIIPIH